MIAFTDNGVHTPTPETIAAVEAAVAAVAATGATISWDVPPDIAEAADTWDRLIRADGHAWLRRLITAAGTPGVGTYETAGLDRPRRGPLGGDELTALVEHADRVRSRMLAWFDADVIVCPAMPHPAVRHGESSEPWFADTYSDVHNLTGWPSVVVRGGWSSDDPPAPDRRPAGGAAVARGRGPCRGAASWRAASGGWQAPPL